jgi:hypothetical protein
MSEDGISQKEGRLLSHYVKWLECRIKLLEEKCGIPSPEPPPAFRR